MTAAHQSQSKQPLAHQLKLAETASAADAATPERKSGPRQLLQAMTALLLPARRGFYYAREAERFHAEQISCRVAFQPRF